MDASDRIPLTCKELMCRYVVRWSVKDWMRGTPLMSADDAQKGISHLVPFSSPL